MEIYFIIGLFLIVLNGVCIILTAKLNRNEFTYDEGNNIQEFPYGFKLLGIVVSIVVFLFCFVIEYLCSNSLPFLLVPILIGYPIYYYFLFICNFTHTKKLHRKEFFYTMFTLTSLFYLLFIPLAKDVSLNYQINLIIATQLPLLELGIIFYVNLFIYALLLNLVLYFDAYNYIIKKQNISAQQFRQQHSALSIAAFIVAGYISSIILNSQFLTYPNTFDFSKFQNILVVYQLFLSSIAIIISLNKKQKSK